MLSQATVDYILRGVHPKDFLYTTRHLKPLKLLGGIIKEEAEGYRKSRRCSRDTYPESYITKYTSI